MTSGHPVYPEPVASKFIILWSRRLWTRKFGQGMRRIDLLRKGRKIQMGEVPREEYYLLPYPLAFEGS